MWSKSLNKPVVDTVYIGGGTPSDVPIEYLHRLFVVIEKSFNLTNPEITIEVNPKAMQFNEFRILGVNRLSIGLQAADDEVLKTVNRRHTFLDFQRTFDEACCYFENINIDFILGLPKETDKTLENDLRVIENYKPKHVSVYILETDSEKNRNLRIDEDLTAMHHEIFTSELQKMGYVRYEISNFSLPAYRCRHNVKYWNNENYIGVGASAGGHIGLKRYVNSSNLLEYFHQIEQGENPFEYFSENTPYEELRETLFMGLRLCEGVELEKLEKLKPGIDFRTLVEKFPTELILEHGRLRLSKKGMDFSHTLLSEIMHESVLSGATGGE